MEDFRRLLVWQRAHALAVRIYGLCRRFPAHEQCELARQMRRAATSVSFNIAEASGRRVARRRNADPLRYLAIASGSLLELDAQCELARDVGYVEVSEASSLIAELGEIRRMLASLITHRSRIDRFKPRNP